MKSVSNDATMTVCQQNSYKMMIADMRSGLDKRMNSARNADDTQE